MTMTLDAFETEEGAKEYIEKHELRRLGNVRIEETKTMDGKSFYRVNVPNSVYRLVSGKIRKNRLKQGFG